jgi:type VI secretion system secreted protein Hcp
MVAFDYFLHIDGIPGESKDAKHKDEIDVLSWSWGETLPAPANPGSGAATGKVAMTDLQVSTNLSKASPQLLLACASGQRIKSAVLTGRKPGKAQQEYLTFSLSDVLVTGYQTGGATAEAPLDSISLNFSKIELSYREQKADGSLAPPIRVGWDRRANKAF